jgi:TonB family protein
VSLSAAPARFHNRCTEEMTVQRIDQTQQLNTRNPAGPEDEAAIAALKRLPGQVFHGWGPQLMVAALALASALAPRPATANVVAVSACEDHGARLIDSPAISTPEEAPAGGEAVLRVGLSAAGQILNVTIAQSAGDALLDFEAMRVARESRYAAAFVDCKPAADDVLYRVSFSN